jgi:DNA-binding CsgD family transcriptional regulator
MNVWIQRSQPLLTSGRVVTSEMACPSRDLIRTEYYNDFLRPYDIFHSFAAVVLREGETISLLTSCRPARRGAFDDSDVSFINALLPHVARAVQIQRRLGLVDAVTTSVGTALDRVAYGVLLVDAAGHVVFANRVADDIVRSRDGLSIDRNEIRACRAGDTSLVRQAIHEALRTGRRDGFEAGTTLSVGRPSGRRPLTVVIAPLVDSSGSFSSNRPAAIICVTDPERVLLPSEDDLQRSHGLTPAEVRLARALAEGLNLQGAARRLGLTTDTVRTRLKSIFAKTSTHRQSDLVRLILTSAPAGR